MRVRETWSALADADERSSYFGVPAGQPFQATDPVVGPFHKVAPKPITVVRKPAKPRMSLVPLAASHAAKERYHSIQSGPTA